MSGTASVLSCPVCNQVSALDGRHLGGYALMACPGCGYRFFPKTEGVVADYDEVYQGEEYFNEQIRSLQESRDSADFINHPTYRRFFSRLQPQEGPRLLDIGCGVGRFCQAAASVGWQVEGIDLSERAIAIAAAHHPFPVRVATVEALADQSASYDVITAFEVLEHLDNPRAFLSQVALLLRDGGEFFCTVPNWDCQAVQSATRPDWVPPVHVGFHTVSSLKTLAVRSGFAEADCGVIWTDPFPFHPMNGLRWLRRRLRGAENAPLGLWLHARKSGAGRQG
ncbi:class I SAM-dependent methyltransferase [Geomonas sp. Red32]|uniref:class I SAM-dependent methyltransferase n=1 Tax=Geomonas sp. Red32 TaxID=2912856 RepID=UPI00202CCC5C|nr:class I SAM-dependent methyltransferase [Geomonas sp. Red32]MCM0081374.1 class I SAM-dependent methyltransferase [Geomonas sp. Red32]